MRSSLRSHRSSSWLLATALATSAACTSETSSESTPAEPAPSPPTACPAPRALPTTHGGPVKASEVWTAEASPHHVTDDIAVEAGAVLSIEPCAVVQFASGKSLRVRAGATLSALGRSDAPIALRGADASGWGQLFVQAPGEVRLAHVTLEGGGRGEGGETATILAYGDGSVPARGTLFVDHVSVKGSAGAGVRLDRASAFAKDSRALTVTGSGAQDAANPWGLEVTELGVDGIPDGTFTGNARDEILIDPFAVEGRGGFLVDATMHARGVPYHFGRVEGHDDLAVGYGPSKATLTIEAGVEIRFEKMNGVRVESSDEGRSAIVARGTAERPIVFTSAAASPAPGDWRGFYFNGPMSADNELKHVRIAYTGADCGCRLVNCSGQESYEGAIILASEPRGMFLLDSSIEHGAGHGVVQGYDGIAWDFAATNTFADLAGCSVTRPRNADTSCPEAEAECR